LNGHADPEGNRAQTSSGSSPSTRNRHTTQGAVMIADTQHTTDKTVTRRFSEGVEQLPETPEKNATRRFSEGIEQRPDAPEKTAR
jgi:hypothetical protein